ncbi:DNA repair protein crb2 [Hypsizygus marmoreus]|uniref:DNA repair protein crb2 n=1 Tax=Hypsizygus marmoreus TaxID=39966 RepID=A0A369JPF0_HYPMA|nr:DNA repair protein crb2 [Hypsizygus marmoreus]
MDALHNGSDVEDESQATQLLQNILEPGELSWNFDVRGGDESNLDKNVDPSPSRNSSNSLPHYHFHGLASTQTQIQDNDDELEIHQSSQKENISAEQLVGGANSLSLPPQGSPSKNTPMNGPRTDALSRVTKPVNNKAVSFQSPRKTGDPPNTNAPTRPLPGRSTTYPITRTTTTRAGSESSQDSFAGVVPQDPQQQFLAASKQFDVPLSELPRVLGGGTYESTGGESADSMYTKFNPSRRLRRSSTPPQGHVLVEATPSLSGDSQSQPSQPFDDSQQYISHRQPDPMDVDVHTDGSQYSDAPSSSYARHLEDRDEDPVPLPTLEPTQPSTQVEDNNPLDVTDNTNLPANPPLAAGSSAVASSHIQPSAASTVPRSRGIASLIAPNKRWRYQQYLDRQEPENLPHVPNTVATSSAVGITVSAMEETQPSLDEELPPPRQFPIHSRPPNPVPSVPLEHTQPSFDDEISRSPPRQFPTRSRPPNLVPSALVEETQPSFDDFMTRPSLRQFPNRSRPLNTLAGAPMEDTQPSLDEEPVKPSPRQFPPRFRPANPSPPRKPVVAAGPSRQARDDAMDIVPDSEPSREEETPSAPRTRGATRSPAKQPPQRINRTASPQRKARDVVPDSMAVDQNEDLTELSEVDNALLQDEPEDEEDIPLAKVVSKNDKKHALGRSLDKGKGKAPADMPAKGKQASKGKQKATAAEPAKRNANQRQPGTNAPPAVVNAPIAGVRPTRAAASLPVKKATGGRSWETGEVPSSLPEQDLAKPLGSSRPVRGKNPPVKSEKVKAAATGTRTTKAKRNATAPTAKARRRSLNDDEEEEDEKSSESEDDELLMAAHNEDDVDDDSTEPADDEYMDPNFQTAGPSRKRKRGAAAAKPTRARTKVSSKNSKATDTPIVRQTKRLRSAASTSKSSNIDATRVFALWKQDGHYYPGTVHSLESDYYYKVDFDDTTHSTVSIDQMRLLELRVGDDVLIPNFMRGTKVVDVSKAGSGIVSVRVDDEIREVTLQAIKIASRTISSAWKDRTLSAESITTKVKPAAVKASPTPSRLSVASGSMRSTIFGKTAMVITITAGGVNWEREREAVMSAIKNHGGTVIDDWAALIRMEGKHSHANNRWVIHKEDARWQGKQEIERVFLLADDASLKPKFLIALALGVPCLSVNWIKDSIQVGEEKDWGAYLLPQGYSDALGARPSQQIDSDWGNSIHQINEIMDNSVARKIFDGKSILCFGAEMVPLPKGKKLTGAEEKMQEAHNAVTRIILAMGAKFVEAVSELKYASAPVDEYDFVIIKELHHYGSQLEGGTVVHWSWVKDCLIASRQLPLPEWDQPCSESQDA